MAQYAGFSLHAGIGVEADQREKLERLARYVLRPARREPGIRSADAPQAPFEVSREADSASR